jgi:uncharacterized surface protein with fasciclin (FAS1) repeats
MKTMLKRLVTGSFILLFAVAIHSNTINAQGNAEDQPQGETVVDKVESNEDTSDFAEILKVSGFAEVLKKQGPFTVLAPSNEALQSGEVDVEKAKEDQKAAQQVAQSHLYQGELPAEEVEASMEVEVQDSDDSPSNGTVYFVDQIVTR